MSDVVIRVDGLGKRYRIGSSREPYNTLRESMVAAAAAPLRRARAVLHGEAASAGTAEFWALRGVSFEVLQGQVLGVIGRNGAGKSTLLKLLARVTSPSEGEAIIRGRLGALLEVGTGFHPELTGRENIYLNGSILGMRRSEIDRRFDEIVEFSEISRFLDTPVKRYSSGMYVRLAFSVAAHLEPEVLVVDEVLAVGDLAFQRKCLGKMGAESSAGRTVLFVSHNLAAVRKLCHRACLIEGGHLVAFGGVEEVVSQYLSQGTAEVSYDYRERIDRQGSGRLRFTGLRFADANDVLAPPSCGRSARLELSYEAQGAQPDVHVSVAIDTAMGEHVGYLSNEISGSSFPRVPASGSFYCDLDRLPLLPGSYKVSINVTVAGEIADWLLDAGTLPVAGGDFFGSGRLPPEGFGAVALDQDWCLSAGPKDALPEGA